MQSLPLENIDDNNYPIETDDDDPNSKQYLSPHIEPFHRQRRIDGTLPFNEQILTMQHIVFTNGLNGKYNYNENTTDSEMNQGGIWKEIIHNGIGQKPTIGASVRLHYYAYFEHRDEPFDTSFKRRRAFEFHVGKCEVLPGIDLAVSTMQKRERAKFIISSDLLYGELGCTPHIPESSWCLYIIELLSTNEPTTAKVDNHLTIKTITPNRKPIDDFARRIRLAQTLRNTGNEQYANGQLDRAIRTYNKARQLIHNRVTLVDGKDEEQYHQLLLKLHLNSAQCYLRLDDFEKCLHACRDALVIEPNNLKALFRASISLRSLNQLEQAEKYLSKALTIDPQNRDLLNEVTRLKEALDLALQTLNKKTEKSSTIDLEDVLSCIAVSDEFRIEFESKFQDFNNNQFESIVIQRDQYSETEFYYIETLAKSKQLTIHRINNDTIQITK